MKMNYLMKGMAVMALSLVAVSCNKMDSFNPYAEQEIKQEEFTNNFQTEVLNGKSVDANQTWATTTAEQLSVKSDFAGTLKIYTANPHGEIAASLYTQDIEAGTHSFTVAKPSDEESLYAKLILDDGTIRVSEFTDNAVSFVKSAANTAAYQAARRANRKGVEFPDAPTSYPTTYPQGAEYYAGGYKYFNGGTIYMDETTSNHVEVQGYCDMYVVKNGNGIITPSSKWYVGNVPYGSGKNIRVFICSGVTLDISQNQNIQADVEIYVLSGATLKCSSQLILNSTAKVFVASGGTLNVPSISINADNYGGRYSLFYNQSTTTVSGDITVTNGKAVIINEGTLTAANLNVTGSGMFWNKEGGTTNITNAAKTSGTTTVNSNDAVWINDGQYNTVNYDYTAGSVNVWNNCKLTVYNKFYINLGQNSTSAFKMDGGSSAIIKEFVMDANSRVIMGGNSIIKVTEKTVMNNTAQSFEDAGIIGPTSGNLYAVLQSPTIVKANDWNSKYVCYNGNVYIATDSHFAQKDEETHNPMYRILGNARIVDGQNNAPYTIPANGNCSDGYRTGGGSPAPAVEPTMYYYYAFEDLGTTDDFDFNDIVIRVSAPVNGKSTVTLMAAGGIYPAVVTYGTGSSMRNIGEEVHAAFGVSTGNTDDMVNTGGKKKEFVTLGTIENLSANADISQLPMGITVTGNNGQITRVECSVANKGKAPLMIAVSGYSSGENAGKWFWPLERTNISSAYTQFGEWGANASTNKDWYKYFTNGKVYKWQ